MSPLRVTLAGIDEHGIGEDVKDVADQREAHGLLPVKPGWRGG